MNTVNLYETPHGPSETSCRSASQEMYVHLWNSNVHCRANNSSPLVHLMRKLNLLFTLILGFKIHFNIILASSPWSYK